MAVDERRGSVVLAEQAAVDVVEAVTRDQAVPAGGARETLERPKKKKKWGAVLTSWKIKQKNMEHGHLRLTTFNWGAALMRLMRGFRLNGSPSRTGFDFHCDPNSLDY